jgi:hypothetical protein
LAWLEFDQHVELAIWPKVVPDYRIKQGQTLDAVPSAECRHSVAIHGQVLAHFIAHAARLFEGVSRNVAADVVRQHFVYERLIANASATRFFAELIEYSSINANRNELSGLVAQRRTADAPHSLQLIRRRIGNLGIVNLSRGTPSVPGGSRAAR